MKVLAIAATNNKESINRKLLEYVAILVKRQFNEAAEIEVINLIDYELPFYRQDREEIDGISEKAQYLYKQIGLANYVFISFAEHNGSYTAVYKNIFDWMSRINTQVYQEKPVILLSTSPGPGGAKSVLSMAEKSAKFFGMNIKSAISIPSFYDNFKEGKLTNNELDIALVNAIRILG